MKHLKVNDEHLKQLKGFEEWLRTLGYAKTTVYNAPNYVREYLAYRERSDNDVDTFIERISERVNTRRGGGLTAGSINKVIQGLKLFSKYLQLNHSLHLPINVKQKKSDRKESVVLSEEEIKELLEVCGNDLLGLRDRAMLAVYFGCGLRRNEGVELTVKDVQLDNRLIYVRSGKNYKQRYVPMTTNVMLDLKEYIKVVRPKLLKSNRTDTLFLSSTGKPLQAQSLYLRLKRLQSLCDSNALRGKDIGLHTLRHSLATILLNRGLDIYKVSQMLGHSSLTSTQVYLHHKR